VLVGVEGAVTVVMSAMVEAVAMVDADNGEDSCDCLCRE
jgi:hypothetical protein